VAAGEGLWLSARDGAYWTVDREVARLETGNCLYSQITLMTQAAEKLELTAEQINNPQSACGSVSIVSYSGIGSLVGESVSVAYVQSFY
jgi:hypothetical protein